MTRYITILEVSQKQAYIFGSNKVADNIINSAIIAKCLSPEYIKNVIECGYDEDKNLVYSGGGHTILEHPDKESARTLVMQLTERIYRDYDGLEVFAKTIAYRNELSPRDNLKVLTSELEKKKSVRRSGFHHGSFGIEIIDVNTRKPESLGENSERIDVKNEEDIESKEFTPDGYAPAKQFEDLGMEKNRSNFIAVVHIDGNGMGKRVEELYDRVDSQNWDAVKDGLRKFSNGIDADFKSAFKEMTEEVSKSLNSGSLEGKLNLGMNNGIPYFPVRRIITAGDDICFVTEGRIGIECARIFIEKLYGKSNCVDGKNYTACAGVAIVHQKYPFYKAYELAEKLCSSAKKFGASVSPDDDGRNVCSIDWHIEFGEIKDSIDDIKKDYIAGDGGSLSNKPYVIKYDSAVCDRIKDERKYGAFADNISKLQDTSNKIGIGKIKQLRSVMKKGATETGNYMKFYKMNGRYSFDAIEMMDTFLAINEVGK